MVPLRTDTLAACAERLATPCYDRARLTAGVVHIGVGGFHRAHQAMYHERLMSRGEALDWAIRGIGVLPGDRRMQAVMEAQDGLYTLVVKHPDGTLEPTAMGAIVGYVFAPDDPEATIEAMADAATRIVSLTITEGGYNLHHVTADLQPGSTPPTTFGLVTEALRRR